MQFTSLRFCLPVCAVWEVRAVEALRPAGCPSGWALGQPVLIDSLSWRVIHSRCHGLPRWSFGPLCRHHHHPIISAQQLTLSTRPELLLPGL